MAIRTDLLPWITPRFWDDVDPTKPLANGMVYFYDAGTSDAKPVYTDRDGTIPYPNPIELDAAGKAPGMIWLGQGFYDVEVRDKDGALQWSAEVVSSVSESAIERLDTRQEIRELEVEGNEQLLICCTGKYSSNGSENRIYYYDPLNSTADNDDTILTPSTSPLSGRWVTFTPKELESRFVSIENRLAALEDEQTGNINSITTEELITGAGPFPNVSIQTVGFYSKTSGGGAIWNKTGNTGTPGTTEFENGLIYDGEGNERTIVNNDIDPLMYGAVRNSDASATLNVERIQAAIDFSAANNRKCVYGGTYSINAKLWIPTYFSGGSYAQHMELKWLGGDGAATPGPTGGDAVVTTVPNNGSGGEDRTQFTSRVKLSDMYVNLNGANDMIAFQIDRFSNMSSAENLYVNYPGTGCIEFYFRETWYASYKKLYARDFQNDTATAKTAGNRGFFLNGVPNGVNSILFDKCAINKFEEGIVFYSDGAQGGLATSIVGTTVENCAIGVHAPAVADPADGFTSLDMQLYLEGNDVDIQWEQEATKIDWRNIRLVWGGSTINLVKGLHSFSATRDFYNINIVDAEVYADFNNTLPSRQVFAKTTGTGFFRYRSEEFEKNFDRIPTVAGYKGVEGDGYKKLRELTNVSDSGVRRPTFGTIAGYNGKIYSLDQTANNVYEIDPITGVSNQSVVVSGNSKEVIFHSKTKYIYVIESTGLQILNIKNLEKIGDIAIGTGDVTGLATSKDYILTGDNGSKELYSIDPLTESIIGTIALTFSITEIAYYAPKSWIIATHKFSNTVSIHALNESTGAITLVKELTTITLDTPIGVTVDDRFAYVADTGGDIHVIDLDVASPVVNKSITIGGAPEHIAYNPELRIVCAIDKATGTAYEINCRTFELLNSTVVNGGGIDYVKYNSNDKSFLIGSVASERTYLLYQNSYSKINNVGSWATASRPTITPTSRHIGINTDTNKLEHTADSGTTWYNADGTAVP